MLRKLMLLCLAMMLLGPAALATDVTIAAQTYPVGFSPTGIGVDQAITVSATNGSPTVTTALRFPSQAVGISGFTFSLDGVDYTGTVNSATTITLSSNYAGSTGSKTLLFYRWVEVRAYADRAFQPAGESYVVQPGTPGVSGFYRVYAASVLLSGGVSQLRLPAITLPATTDALITNQARYSIGLYRPGGALLQFLVCPASLTGLALPPSGVASWADICTYNSSTVIIPSGTDAYSKTVIDDRFPACSAGEMIYYLASGRQQKCLARGSGLTISAGVLSVTSEAVYASDYGCDLADNANDDTACLNNAAAAALSLKRRLVLPGGTYNTNLGTVTFAGGLVVEGSGRNVTFIKSSFNGVIVDAVEGTGENLFRGPTIRDLTIRGDVSLANQIGLRMTDDNYYFGSRVEGIEIQNTGSHGLYVGNVYASSWSNIFLNNMAGYPLLYDAQNMPTNKFSNIYVGDLRASAPTAYRIKRGGFVCENCNGINNAPAGSKGAVVGRKNGVDGDVLDCNANNCGADFTCTDCNFETFTSHGVLAYGASVINLLGKWTIQPDSSALPPPWGPAGSATVKAIEFELNGDNNFFYARFIRRGRLSSTGGFGHGRSAYANSQFIHAAGFAPVEIEGLGPSVPQEAPLREYYDSAAGVSQMIARPDGVPAMAITSSRTLDIGTRYAEVNCPVGCTVSLPWPGWGLDGAPITLKNIGTGNAVTVQGASGGTINGAATFQLLAGGQATTFWPSNTAQDWRTIGGWGNQVEAVNVRQVGCKGDGIADDTQCISRAITIAQESGTKRAVYFPAGTYLTDPITGSVAGLKIFGDGQLRSVIKARANDQNVFSISGNGSALRFSLTDLGIRGRGKAAGSTGHCLFINDGFFSGFEFRRLDIADCRENGIYIPTLFNGVFDSIQTDEIGGNHFDLGPSSGVTMIGNYVHTVGPGKAGYRLRGGSFSFIGNTGMDPDSDQTALWGLFGSRVGDGGDTQDAYFVGPFHGNNIESFGDVGLRLKLGSVLGSISGNSFITSSASIDHIAIKCDYAGASQPAGVWDQTNGVYLIGGAWKSGAAIHSQGVPFLAMGGSPAQYYETSFPQLVDLPSISAAWDGGYPAMFTKLPYLQGNHVKVGTGSSVTGQLILQNATNGYRTVIESGTPSGHIKLTMLSALPGSTLCLKVSAAGVLSTGACEESTTVKNNQANSYSSGSKQSFSPSATTAGLNVGSVAGDVSSPADGDVWHDSTQKTVKIYADGHVQSIPGVIFVQTADSTIANTASESSLLGTGIGTTTLAANALLNGKTVRVTIRGYLSTKASTPGNVSVKFKLGSLDFTLFTTPAGITANLSQASFVLTFLYTARGSGVSAATIGQGQLTYTDGTLATYTMPLRMASTGAVDTTTSQAIDFRWAWVTADVGNTITTTNAVIEILN